MKLIALALAMGLLLAMIATACSLQSGNSGEKSASNRSKPCPRTSSFAEAEHSTTPSATAVTPVVDKGTATPYEEIWAALQQFNARLEAVRRTTTDSYNITSEANYYLRNSLYQKRISGWRGWIVSTGIEALRSAEMRWDLLDERYHSSAITAIFSVVLVSMEDPLANISTRKPGEREPWFEKPLVLLTDVRETSGQQLCIGQKISFDGYVTPNPQASSGRADIPVANSSVTIVEHALSERVIAPDLEDVLIVMGRIPGWSGPKYNVTVFGDGTVVFEGVYETKANGFRLTTLSKETIRELLREFEKADFFNMPDARYDDNLQYPDFPTAEIILKLGGKNKMVYHYGGPFGTEDQIEKITHLEDRIDELVGTEQWVGEYPR